MREMKEKIHLLTFSLKELYQFKPRIFGAMLVYILTKSSLPLLQLFLSAQVIDWLMEGVSISTYMMRLILFVSILSIVQILDKYFDLYREEHSNKFRQYAMENIATKYLSLDFPLLVGKEAQERYNQANELTRSDLSLFGRFFAETVDLISSFLAILLYLQILIQLDSFLLFLIGLFVLLVIVFNIMQVKMDRKLFNIKAAATQKMRYLKKAYGDSRLTKDVRLYQMKKWFDQVEEQVIQHYHTVMKPKVHLSWTESTILNIGVLILSGVAYTRSVQMISNGTIPVSNFVIFAGSVTILAQTSMQFVSALGKTNINLNEFKKYEEFMSQEQIFHHGEGEQVPKDPLSIELKNVSYTYPNNEKESIKGVSLTINPYENLAIVGENGAGKSTLVNLICGLYQPDSGEILLNGIPNSKFNIQEYYQAFAPVFQEKFLLTYSIRETIVQGLPFDQRKYKKVLELSGVGEMIHQFPEKDETKIVRAVHPDGITLSGGQLQKLKLAQALYKDSPVLILDEPTAALDPIAENQIYQDYFQFSKDKMSLFISHRLSSTQFCDRIIYLSNGEIKEMGTHEELMEAKGDYYKLYEAQAYYYKHKKEDKKSSGGVV